jgi:hypothetical protein
MKEDTDERFLNLGSNIRVNILCVCFSLNLFKKERKLSKTSQISFQMLKAKQINLNVKSEFSSIKV